MPPPSTGGPDTSSPGNGHTNKNSRQVDLKSSEEEWRRLRRCLEAAGKGFAIGAGLKGGLALFSILARLKIRRKLRKVGVMTNSEAVGAAARETLRYGSFLGTFAGTYVSVDELIAAIGGHKRTAGWRSLLAGAIAGPSILLTGPNTQHTSLALYILMRAAVLASRCGIKSRRFGKVCRPLTWSHGDIFLMCLASSQILSAYILKQDSLPSTYRSFLNKHGGKDGVILQGVKEIASNVPFTNLKGIEKYYKSVGVDVKLDPNMKVPCKKNQDHGKKRQPISDPAALQMASPNAKLIPWPRTALSRQQLVSTSQNCSAAAKGLQQLGNNCLRRSMSH